VWVRFAVNTPGRHRYGLMVEGPAPGEGYVVVMEQTWHHTQATLSGAWRTTLVPICLLALVGALGMALIGGHLRFLRERLGVLPLTLGEMAWITGSALALVATQELPALASAARDAGVPGGWLGWLVYVFIPLRWLTAAVVALTLGLRRAAWLLLIALFPAAYLLSAANLAGQAPDSSILQSAWPGLVLAILAIGIRTSQRWPWLGRPAAAAAAVAYCLAALPWFQLYVYSVR
jgi:hypothetical protein